MGGQPPGPLRCLSLHRLLHVGPSSARPGPVPPALGSLPQGSTPLGPRGGACDVCLRSCTSHPSGEHSGPRQGPCRRGVPSSPPPASLFCSLAKSMLALPSLPRSQTWPCPSAPRAGAPSSTRLSVEVGLCGRDRVGRALSQRTWALMSQEHPVPGVRTRQDGGVRRPRASAPAQ